MSQRKALVPNSWASAMIPASLRDVFSSIACENELHSGFDWAFRKLGAAPCQGPDAGRACLLLCNAVHYVLVGS